MGQADSLTISALRRLPRCTRTLAVLSLLTLAACTIEVGPPPESDPPLVPPSAKAPPPPPQPTEPQAWSRDLDLDSGPTSIDHGQLAEGLVASDAQTPYSPQRLTYQSAFEEEKKLSEAEIARQRARERAEAAGLPPPPEVSSAPVEAVNSESLPAPDGTASQRRESRLPPPPKFPPVQPRNTETAAADAASESAPTAEPAAATEVAAVDPGETGKQRQSRLPPPPKFPPLPSEQVADETAAGATDAVSPPAPGTQLASSEAAAPAGAVTETAAAEAGPVGAPQSAEAVAAGFAAEAWDAPSGTILVQVAAVTDPDEVAPEWLRLQTSYPQVLQPLRLVVDKAMLGDRAVFYRVQAGAFGTEAGASAACDALISAGQACFVVVR